jgi:hypothetical protein
MKNKVEPKKKQGAGGISFIAAGIVVMLVPSIFYIILGDFVSLMNNCNMPFATVDIGNNMIVRCTELRFSYVLSYFCLLFGMILVILGIAKKIIEQKKTM